MVPRRSWNRIGRGSAFGQSFMFTTTEKVGLAMIRMAQRGYSKPILETDINALAAGRTLSCRVFGISGVSFRERRQEATEVPQETR